MSAQPPAPPKWLPWNHPLRAEAEKLVQNYNDYAQRHLPSDQTRYLANEIVEFTQRHHAAAQAETVALLKEAVECAESIHRNIDEDEWSSPKDPLWVPTIHAHATVILQNLKYYLTRLKEGAT